MQHLTLKSITFEKSKNINWNDITQVEAIAFEALRDYNDDAHRQINNVKIERMG